MKKLLITGYIRTGMTLLANFLNAQEKCLIYRDFLGNILLPAPALAIRSFLQRLTEGQKNILLSSLKAEFWSAGSNAADCLDTNFLNLRELHENALRAMNDKNDYDIIGSKSTRMGNKLSSLIEELDVSVIYIYRDIRDVLLSAKNRVAGYDLIRFMMEYRRDLDNALKIRSKRLLVVRFEDLILDTSSVVKQLSDFLDISITKDITTAKDRKISWTNNSSFHDISRLFDSGACFRWKNHMNTKEVRYSEILASDLIQKLDYRMDKKIYSISDRFPAYRDLYIRKSKDFVKHLLYKRGA